MTLLVAWVLLTSGLAYLLAESGHEKGWAKRLRQRVIDRGRLAGKMLSCFRCPWGWSGLVVAAGIRGWSEAPSVVQEVLFWIFVPVAGLGLAHLLAYLSPLAAMRVSWERRDGR